MIFLSQLDNWAYGEVPKVTANRKEFLKQPGKDGKLQVVFEEADNDIDKEEVNRLFLTLLSCFINSQN